MEVVDEAERRSRKLQNYLNGKVKLAEILDRVNHETMAADNPLDDKQSLMVPAITMKGLVELDISLEEVKALVEVLKVNYGFQKEPWQEALDKDTSI